jgi:hypothetical protein
LLAQLIQRLAAEALGIDFAGSRKLEDFARNNFGYGVGCFAELQRLASLVKRHPHGLDILRP